MNNFNYLHNIWLRESEEVVAGDVAGEELGRVRGNAQLLDGGHNLGKCAAARPVLEDDILVTRLLNLDHELGSVVHVVDAAEVFAPLVNVSREEEV